MRQSKKFTESRLVLVSRIIIGQTVIILGLFLARFILANLNITSYQEFAFNYQYLKNLQYSNQTLNHKLSLYSNLSQLSQWAKNNHFVSISKYTVLADHTKNRLAVKD